MTETIGFNDFVNLLLSASGYRNLCQILGDVEAKVVESGDKASLETLAQIHQLNIDSAQSAVDYSAEALRRIGYNPRLSQGKKPDATNSPPAPKPSIDSSALYSYADGASLLAAISGNTFYDKGVVKRMTNSGHLEEEAENKVTGKSLEEHLKFMEGKRFFDQMSDADYRRVAAEANKKRTKDIDYEFVRVQIAKGAYQVIGHAKGYKHIEKLAVVTKSDDEIIEMLHKGRWMDLDEIQIMGLGDSRMKRSEISKAFREHETELQSSLDTRPMFAYITPENMHLVGIGSCLQLGIPQAEKKQEQRQSTPVTQPLTQKAQGPAYATPTTTKPRAAIVNYDGNQDITILVINDKKIKFDPTKDYSSNEVREYLRSIHQSAFSPNAVDNAMECMGSSKGRVQGSALISFLNQVNGLILLSSSSGQNKVARELALDSYFEVEKLMERPEYGKYKHQLEGIVSGQFMLKHEIEAMKIALKEERKSAAPVYSPERNPSSNPPPNTGGNHRGNADYLRARDEALQEVHGRLREKRILPTGTIRDILVDQGLLDEGTAERVRETYNALESAMNGYRFFGINAVKEATGLDWRAFYSECLPKLVNAGIVKNITPELGGQGKDVYVLKLGADQEMYDVLGIKPIPKRK